MPNPSSAHSGYELRFTESSVGVYEVVESKWVSGTRTALATKTGYSFGPGRQVALIDKGGTVSAWTNAGSEYVEILSASDSTFTSGYIGVEGSGSSTRLTELKGGSLPPF
jgi:hypothetical protein